MNVALAGLEPTRQSRWIGPKYRLDDLLGEGGMASVWRAWNVQLDMPVAVKLLRPELASAELCESLRTEARAAARLVHPAIVRVFDIEETDSGEPYIVMELLEGESLFTRLGRGRIAAVEAVRLLLPIADALCMVHDSGLLHRDIKPENILLASNHGRLQPKLLDFGIAKTARSVARPERRLSCAGSVVGSPGYMSPEHARGAELDQRTDVWSFCVVMYEVLAGRPPFEGDTATAVLRSILEDAPAPLDPDIDAELGRVIFRGLNKNRSERTPSVRKLGEELAEWLSAHGVREDITGSSVDATWLRQPATDTEAVQMPGLRKSRWRLAVGAAAALSAAAAGAWAATQGAAPRVTVAPITPPPPSAQVIVLAPPPSLCPPLPAEAAAPPPRFMPPKPSFVAPKSHAADLPPQQRDVDGARPTEAGSAPGSNRATNWDANPYGI